jgi:hypothetical protein
MPVQLLRAILMHFFNVVCVRKIAIQPAPTLLACQAYNYGIHFFHLNEKELVL